MGKIFEGVDGIIRSADKLGALSTAAILAFFCLVFLLYVFYLLRQQRSGSELAWEVRFKEVDADKAMASAIEQGFTKVVERLDRVEAELRVLQAVTKVIPGDIHVQVAQDK